jgi:hypothetical protein
VAINGEVDWVVGGHQWRGGLGGGWPSMERWIGWWVAINGEALVNSLDWKSRLTLSAESV